MHKDLQRSKNQYPMIEELIVRGKPLTGSRFKQIDGNSFTPTEIITATEIRLSGAQTLVTADEVYPGSGRKFCKHRG